MQNIKNPYNILNSEFVLNNSSVSRFSDYLQQSFHFSLAEADEIIVSMKKPLGKSIRINTRKISLENFKLHAGEQGWTLTNTDIPEVFLIDRDDTTIALGNTLEHMAGWFYIQEVAAAHPPHLLRQEIVKRVKSIERSSLPLDMPLGISPEGNEGLKIILDMCAAPGGKTTQLADYFPNALVIANEVNRTRTPQLFDNLDRMGYDTIAVVSCDGRFFQNFPDFFDAVLLDAPCSGEGTAFRDSSVIDHWNEKNIHRIAKLQKQLFETAEVVTAPGGTLSYSTCTLNQEENEEVINSLLKREILISDKQDDHRVILKKLFEKRFWPHIEKTGGFFASIFQKNGLEAPLRRGEKNGEEKRGNCVSENPQSRSSTAPLQRSLLYPVLAAQGQKNLIVTPATKGEWETVERFVAKHFQTKLKDGFLYRTKDGIYFNQHNLGPLAEHFYFVHAGMRIGTIKGNTFTPTHHIYWCLRETDHLPTHEITREQGGEILTQKSQTSKTYCVGKYGRGVVGICLV